MVKVQPLSDILMFCRNTSRSLGVRRRHRPTGLWVPLFLFSPLLLLDFNMACKVQPPQAKNLISWDIILILMPAEQQ